jgi:CHAD domain-containing protein
MSKAWPVTGLDADLPLPEAAGRILAVRIAEVYGWRPVVHRPEAVEETHALRISLKRLRYTLELFAPLLGDAGAAQIDRVKDLQEALGDLHDVDVRLELIAAAIERQRADAAADPAVLAGLDRLHARELAHRDATHRTFVQRWTRHQQEGMRRDLVRLSRLSTGTSNR